MIAHARVKKLVAEKVPTITDQAFFVSGTMKAHLADIARVLTKRYSANEKIKIQVVWDKANPHVAYTTNKMIFINADSDLLQDTIRTERYYRVLGLLSHELGHCFYTNFPAVEQYHSAMFRGEWFPSVPNYSVANEVLEAFQGKYKGILFSEAMNFSNIMEDGYIEDRMLRTFPGDLGYGLEKVRAEHWNLINPLSHLIEKEESGQSHILMTLEQLILEYVKFGKFKCEDELKKDKQMQIMYSILPLLDKMLLEDDSLVRFGYVNDLICELWSYIQDYLSFCEEQSEKNGQSETQNQNQNQRQISGQSESGSGSSQPICQEVDTEHSVSTSCTKDREKTREKAKENAECTGSSSKPKSKHTKEETNQGDSSKDKSKTDKADKEDSKDESLSGKNTKKTEEEDKKSSEKEDYEIDTNSSDSDEKNNSDDEEVPSDDAKENSSENDFSQSDDFSSDCEHVNDNDELIPNYGEGSIVYDDEYAAELNEKTSQEISKLLESMAENDAVRELEGEREKELERFANTLSYGNKHRGIHINVHRQKEVSDLAIEQYREASPPLLAISKRLRRSVEQKLKDVQLGGKMTSLPRGRRIESRNLYRNDRRVFYKSSLPQDPPSMAVGVVVDESGSMRWHERYVCARAAAVILYDFCHALNIPITIYGHSTEVSYSSSNEPVALYSYAEFDSYDDKDRYRLMDIRARHNNRDSVPVRFVAEKLLKRPEQEKILIVLSDGRPAANGYSGLSACEDLAQTVKEFEKKKIHFIAAAIGDDKAVIESMYGDSFMDISDLNTLPKKMTDKLKKYIRV